ncbi:hypothetical protein [Arthrobacter sp. NicSoilB8]|uniref:hypothetical protein n=1 Tax=Arthrobacter sp. NicSoilB8 TaxID=2830998 RepID=UPI001CC63956|nr:hypothetical protein [Arthrobacter sp. NicSoilB8]BCW70338.1 hypothetical protein NicSoilB8_13820 [Arthrobacter sp. NicSoilB8]
MTAKNNRPATSRTVEISWGDCNQFTRRRRPIVHSYAPQIISTATWIHWEIRRHLLETETPGKFGTYTMETAA